MEDLRVQEAVAAAGAAGAEVRPACLIWDLDKTYLDTRFESVRSVLRLPFEKAEAKNSFRSAAVFLRELKQGLQEQAAANLTFISASPPFMRKTLQRKFLLDGVVVDALILKDQSRYLKHRQWRMLGNHLFYKLGHLLVLASANPDWQFLCFGDDWEMDLIIYVLFRDLLGGTLDEQEFKRIALMIRATELEVARLWQLALPIHGSGRAVRVFMHRVRFRRLAFLRWVGHSVYAYDSYLQLAARCFQDQLLSASALAVIYADSRNQWTDSEIWLELASGVRHGLIDAERMEPLFGFLGGRLPSLTAQLREHFAGGAFGATEGREGTRFVDNAVDYDQLLSSLAVPE